MNNKIHIGISGWSYWDWKGIFYPEKMKSTEWLKFYAQSFDTTEINSSFYHLPRTQTISGWAEKVPIDFKFCPKISRYLTHIQKLKESEEPLQRFFKVFSSLKKQLGPVLIQLPPSLKFEHGSVKTFFELLKNKYSDYDFALEARHDTWRAKEAMHLLTEYKIAWVISQSGVGYPYLEQITSGNIYLRFHGPGKLYASLYTDEMLQSYAAQFKKWSSAGHSIWAYFNNCYYGYAITNANTLMKMIDNT